MKDAPNLGLHARAEVAEQVGDNVGAHDGASRDVDLSGQV